jgi:hypothetical protein
VILRLLNHLSYANVVATLAIFVALGGTSYAVLQIRSDDVADNSLRSRDVRNNTLRSRDVRDRAIHARDLRRNSLGSGAIKESALGIVPSAANAERLGGLVPQDFKVKCPADTVARAGLCIESSARGPSGFLTALDACDQAGRGLVTMAQLDRYARLHGPLPQAEWTASVYRNPGNGPTAVEQLEAVILGGFGDVSYDRVYLAVQHGFRCVDLPSN